MKPSKSSSRGGSGGAASSNGSSSSSAISAANKAVDESHMKALRELSHLEPNRHCFECGQRGPSYVDVTIGSFVCMTCSGLLRGLTPPHRVKSISMATFTSDEIQVLKSRGNEYCRKVWLATYSARDSVLNSGGDSEGDRRAALKSHMSAKYEQKRYYLDPAKMAGELAEVGAANIRALANGAGAGSSTSASSSNRSPSLSSASSGSSLQINGVGGAPSPIMNNLRNGRLPNSQTLPDLKPLSSLFPAPPTTFNFINNLSSGPNGNVNVNVDDKIINTAPKAKDPWGDSNFANFDEAFNSNNSNNFAPAPVQTQTVTQNGNFANFDAFAKSPLIPSSASSMSPNANVNLTPSSVGVGANSGDRYAALKDLDELFKVDTPNNNSAMSSSASVPVNLSSAAASNGWGGSPKVNPFAQGGSPTPGALTGFGSGGNNFGNFGGNGWSPNLAGSGSTNPHNPFFATTAFDSFGVTSNSNNMNGTSRQQFGAPSVASPSPMFNPFVQPIAPFGVTANSNPHNPFL